MKIIFLVFQSLILALIGIKLALNLNISVISIGICEIIENFYTKYSRNLDIIDFGGTNDELIGQIMKNVNSSMAITIQTRINWKKCNKKIENQSILLFESFKNLSYFTDRDLMFMQYLNPIRLIVYYPNADVYDIFTLRTDTWILHYFYFIATSQELNTMTLWTFNNQNDINLCTENQNLGYINEFSSIHLKWKIDPIIPKKFMDFYGCIMNIGIPSHTNLFLTFNNKNHINEFLGDLMEVLSKSLNFFPNGKLCLEYDCHDHIDDGTFIYNILAIGTTDAVLIDQNIGLRWVYVMMGIECTLVL